MEFGKLDDIREVDFSLPEDPRWNEGVFQEMGASTAPVWHTGCTGWAMKEWAGHVYPSGSKSQDFLTEYGKQFNTIELNVTHYQIPNPETIQKWKEQTPADFRFCPKVYQGISHSRNLGIGSGQIEQFCRSIEGLSDRLGPCFLQLPPGFGPESLDLLASFMGKWPQSLPVAVEFRNQRWFGAPGAIRRAAELLHGVHAGMVITDVAGRRDVLHMYASAPFALIRFVGNGLHPTDYTRAQDWVVRLGLWIRKGIRDVYFFAHEPGNLLAPELAQFVTLQVEEHLPSVHTRGPLFVTPPGGNQLGLFG
ncbi:MAG: DUF72 domain-containing protein [Haliscomenobacter sp.]|nr:DUF72 domain-containing protein [Haliscomenobacter sp.]